MKVIKKILLSGHEVWPLVEGGKGLGVTDGVCSGAWAAEGGVGTLTGLGGKRRNAAGDYEYPVFLGQDRHERSLELIDYHIESAHQQALIAQEKSQGCGRIHVNFLWEVGFIQEIIQGFLKRSSSLIHGITCGAGLPFELAPLCAEHEVFYHPIVSSARAFRILWIKSFRYHRAWLGSVVYEDPWMAGGHNGISSAENPRLPQDPYPRVKALRDVMRTEGLGDLPIIMAGGVWNLSEWAHWIDNEELGPIAFQLGTRPLLTQESPISAAWKQRLMTLKDGDISLHQFSPTGFFASSVRNSFLKELEQRLIHQIPYTDEPHDSMTVPFSVSVVSRRPVYITPEDALRLQDWQQDGFTIPLKTPDQTLIFVSPSRAESIRNDQQACKGCLSRCRFSNWDDKKGTTGKLPDPRSFCIFNSLMDISWGKNLDDNLMFAGHQAYRFSQDPLYAQGHIPTVAELMATLLRGA